jgi:hypothetical protein
VPAAVVDGRFFVYHGLLADLAGGRVYRLLRNEPHVTVVNWQNAYAWVHSVRAGLVRWSEDHPDRREPWNSTGENRTLHMTPLPGG